jgi:putative transposase
LKTTLKSDSHFMQILSQACSGIPVSDQCREHGMSSATFYKWRAKYDCIEIFILEWAIEMNIPVLGVCRGMQLIQDFFGIP